MTRGRKPATEPTVEVHLRLRRALMAEIEAHLYSAEQGRIPHGQLSAFFDSLAVRAVKFEPLDLAPYSGDFAGLHVIRAAPETIARLKELLQK